MRKLIIVGSIAGALLAGGGWQAAQGVFGCLPSNEDGRVCYATGNSSIHRRVVVSIPGTGLGKISVYQDSTGTVSAGAIPATVTYGSDGSGSGQVSTAGTVSGSHTVTLPGPYVPVPWVSTRF